MSFFEDDGPDVGESLHQVAREISGGGNAIVSGLKTLATGLVGGTLGNAITSPLVLGFGALALGTGALISAFKSATDEAKAYASALSSLRASQGLSFNQSFALAGSNAILGISPQSTAAMFAAPNMNPFVAGIRAGALGATSPYSPDAMANNTKWYQQMASQGPFGRMLANSRLDALYGGRAPDEVRMAMNQRPGAIQAQLAYAANTRRAYGVTGEMLRSYAEDIPMAKARVAYNFDMAKVKFAVEIAPLLEKSLTSFATMLANNAPKIATGIQTIGKFLVQDFPPMLMRGGSAIARGLGGALTGFGAFAKGLAGNVRPMLGVFDAILNGLRSFAATAAGVGAMIVQGVGALWAGIQQSGIPRMLQWAGNLVTHNGNRTQEDRTANSIVAGAGLRFLGPLAGGLLVRPALGLIGRTLTGGSAGGSGNAIVSGLRTLTRGAAGAIGSGLTSAGAFFGSTATGTLGGATLSGVGAAFGATPVGLGLATGVAGYEGLRMLGNRIGGPVAGFPSTYQMGAYGYYRARGYSQNDAGRLAQGLQIQEQYDAAKRQNAVTQGLQNGLLGTLGYVPGRSMGDAFSAGSNSVLSRFSTSNMMNDPARIGTLERMFGGAGDAATAGGQKLNLLGDALEKSAGKYESEIAQQLKTIADAAQKNAASSEQIERNTDKGAQSQADLLANFPQMMRDLVALTSAFIAQDAAMSILGS